MSKIFLIVISKRYSEDLFPNNNHSFLSISLFLILLMAMLTIEI
jgi:hypothetical protein